MRIAEKPKEISEFGKLGFVLFLFIYVYTIFQDYKTYSQPLRSPQSFNDFIQFLLIF